MYPVCTLYCAAVVGGIINLDNVELVESEGEKKYWDQWSRHRSSLLDHSNASNRHIKLQLHRELLALHQPEIKLTIDIWSNNGLGE